MNRYQLSKWKSEGKTEVEVASLLGVSRNTLYKWRKKFGIPVEHRSDKGSGMSREEKRKKWNAYMRRYRASNKISD